MVGVKPSDPHGQEGKNKSNLKKKNKKLTKCPTILNILLVLTLNVPRKVYNGSGYDGKCPSAELYLCPIP